MAGHKLRERLGSGYRPPAWMDGLDYAELLLTRASSRGACDVCRVVVDGHAQLLAIPRHKGAHIVGATDAGVRLSRGEYKL